MCSLFPKAIRFYFYLKTPDDFKPSVTQNYVDNLRNDENLSSNVGSDDTCVFQLPSGVKKNHFNQGR